MLSTVVTRVSIARLLWQAVAPLRLSLEHYSFSLEVLGAMHAVQFSALPVQAALDLLARGVAEGRLPEHFAVDRL